MSKIIRSSDFNKQPAWFKGLNLFWRWSYPLGTRVRLDKDDLIRAAKKSTGLDDLGKDFYDEPLDRLLWSVNHEARLHPVGTFITRQRLINLIGVRLRAEMWFKKYPEILAQPVYPVWVIAGLQRTGTTKLHRLLAADPDNRVVFSWEAINPAPFNETPQSTEKRIRIARRSEQALRIMAPGFFAIHPVEHLEPEEDILLLDTTFLSTTPEATMHVPSYASWLETVDQSPAYAYGAKLLKLLQWQRPGKRWILKSPHHLEFLGLMEQHYGAIHVIWTHRKVTKCIPSFLSMVAHSRSIFSDSVDPGEVAAHWVRKIGFMLSKGMEYRQMNGHNGMITDILFKDLVEDATAQLLRIYEAKGLNRPGLQAVFRQAEESNPYGRYGHHFYKPIDFGITDRDIRMCAGEYERFFGQLFT